MSTPCKREPCFPGDLGADTSAPFTESADALAAFLQELSAFALASMKRCHDLRIVGSFEVLAVNATCSFVIVGSQAMPNSVAEKRPNMLEIASKITWLGRIVYFALLLDERKEHKADYVPWSKRPARGKKDGRAGGYVESWQGVRRRGEGRGFGLKSRINLKIGTKNGLRGRWGFGLMEAR